MNSHKSFKFRIYPSLAQRNRMGQWENALRFLWNLAHEQRLMGLRRTEKRYLSAFDQGREITELRASLPWLNDVPRDVCEAVLATLDAAWRGCFDRIARAPKWKKRGQAISLKETHSKSWRISDRSLHFPKLGPMRIVYHRPLVGTPKSCIIKRDGDQWFAVIVCAVEAHEPDPRTEPVIALDLGIANFAGTSDGELIPNPRHLEASLKRLARAHRTVSRRRKGSKNREKANAHVARIYRKVRRQREHHLHVLSARFAKSHGVVVLEKLNVAGMIRGNCARSIADAGWSSFANMLRYKLAERGGSLIEVNPAYTSQKCAECGAIDAASRPSQSEFACTSCGHRDHADLNAAKNIKSRASRSVQLGEASPLGGRRTKKRSPMAVETRCV